MNGRVSVEVERTYPVAVLRPSGTLDADTALDLRDVLLESLVRQPAGVVLDLFGLTIVDEAGLSVLTSVAQENARWPGAEFALTGRPEVRAAAHRLGIDRHLRVCDDRGGALSALATVPVPALRRDHLRPERAAPGLARVAVQEFCEQQGVGPDADAAQLIASELVTNAVVHTNSDMELTLRMLPRQLQIAVRDGGSGRPRLAPEVDENSATGRGLLLVDALASRWGTFVPRTGKVVWAAVPVGRPPPGPPRSL